MSVTLDPAQLLTFARPLTVVVKRTLTIGNAGDEPVAFKVKTTAPKLYCVRPNAGRIQPGEMVDVIVMLLPMKEDPPLSTKCKDKFLVQSTIIPPEKDHLPFQDVWNVGPEEPPLDVHQQKIKVAWLPPEGLPTTEEGDENEYANQSLMSHAGDESHYVTVRGAPPTNGINGSTVIINPPAEPHLDPRASTPPLRAFSPAYHDSADDHHEVPPIITVHTPPRTPPPAAPAAVEYSPPPAAVPIPAPSSHPEPAPELQEALAEIARLRSLVDSMPTPAAVEAAPEQTLRQRKGLSREADGHKEDSRDVSYEQSVDGFSPQQVLFIAAAVFVLTYLFF